MSKLRTPTLRLILAALERKPISTACTWDLFISGHHPHCNDRDWAVNWKLCFRPNSCLLLRHCRSCTTPSIISCSLFPLRQLLSMTELLSDLNWTFHPFFNFPPFESVSLAEHVKICCSSLMSRRSLIWWIYCNSIVNRHLSSFVALLSGICFCTDSNVKNLDIWHMTSLHIWFHPSFSTFE